MFPSGIPLGVASFMPAPRREPVYVGDADHHQGRIDALRRLTDAAFEYLAYDDKDALAAIAAEPEPAPQPPMSEMLMHQMEHSQRSRERLEHQIEQFENILTTSNMPDTVLDIFRLTFLQPLKDQLVSTEGYMSDLQKQMEACGTESGG